jgi:hypothetical protein
MTKNKGDRLAGGHPPRACAFLAAKVHLLLPCSGKDLPQVVDRLKSRLATLIFFERKDSHEQKLWGKGFWYMPLLNNESIDKTIGFIERQHGIS